VSLTAPPVSHRERKKLATRQAIHDAAFDLVDRHGLSGTTIEAISDRAGVAPRTFWSYFGSKEEAVVNRDPDIPGALATALLARPPREDAFTALRAVLEEFSTDRAIDSKRAVRRGQLIRREPQLMAAVAASFEEIERALVAAMAERLGVDPAADLTPGVLVVAGCGACRVAQQHWSDEGGRRPFREVLWEAYDSLDRGLGRVR
jgi:AcrR family transcriptional regulator